MKVVNQMKPKGGNGNIIFFLATRSDFCKVKSVEERIWQISLCVKKANTETNVLYGFRKKIYLAFSSALQNISGHPSARVTSQDGQYTLFVYIKKGGM